MPSCIYCGTSIPAGVGVRCKKCDSPSSTKSYDRELMYDPDIFGTNEERVPELMAEAAANQWKTTGNETKEEAQRLFESNVDARRRFRWSMQDEFKSAREGRILHMNSFLSMVKAATNLEAWYTDRGALPKTLGLFVSHGGIKKSCQHEPGQPHYVCFVQVPFMQEYEELFFDQYDVPLGSKRRGWRTVLLRLIEQQLCSEEKAHEVFGHPASGPVSRRYRETLKDYRRL